MKYSTTTKSNEMDKIIKMYSRDCSFDRNGGGQWVAINRPHKNKKKYDRKQFKNETRNSLNY